MPLNKIALWLFIAGLFMTARLSAKVGTPLQETVNCANPPRYSDVMDIIFPRVQNTQLFTIILRFSPNNEAESQIVIRKDLSGKTTVELQELKNKTESIAGRYQLLQSKACTSAEIAKNISVNSQQIKINDRVLAKLMSDLPKAFSIPNPKPSIVVDGNSYEFWIDTLSDNAYLALVGSYSGDQPLDYPLVKWMAKFRTVVKQNVTSSK